MMLCECVLVFALWFIESAVYMFTILQWLVFIDYSLYRSMDHVRRRYRYAAIPIFIVAGLDLIGDILLYIPEDVTAIIFNYAMLAEAAKSFAERLLSTDIDRAHQ